MFNPNDMTCQTCKKQRGDNPLVCEECLEYLNWCRVLAEPYRQSNGTLCKVEHQQSLAIAKSVKYIHEMDLQEIFMIARCHEAMAAAASLVYNQGIIKERIPDPKAIEEKAIEWNTAIAAQKMKDRPKIEKKQLSDREKLIAKFVNLGISESDAANMVDEQFKKLGKVVA